MPVERSFRGRLLLPLATLLLVGGLGCQRQESKPAAPENTPAATPPASTPATTKLGMALAGAPRVEVGELLANPRQYLDKVVRLEGLVQDFCHHKRAWFGISAADGKGMVRVFAAPRFLAPADCKGKRAVAEGKVELVTIPAEQVAHYSKEHIFLQGVKVEPGQDVVLPVVRAFGAEFM